MNLMIIVPITFLLSVLMALYFKFIFNKKIDIFIKIISFIIIILIDVSVLYFLKVSLSKKTLFTYNRLNLQVSLDKSSNFLSKESNDNKRSEYLNFRRGIEKDIFEISTDIFSKNNIRYNPKERDELTIIFNDRTVVKDGVLEYFLETSIKYSEDKRVSIITPIKDIDNLKFITYKEIFKKSLNILIESIKYKNLIKDKTAEELVKILSSEKKLPQPFYTQIFSRLLSLDNYPKIPENIMEDFITNPTTFSEASGYAVLSNDCNSVTKIIERSLIYRRTPLMLLLDILSQSDCKVAKGYIFTLTSSRYPSIKELALKNFKEMEKHSKEINYKDGKRE